jgi:hypothetical protein
MKKLLVLALLAITLGVNAQKKLTVRIESQDLGGQVVEEPVIPVIYDTTPSISREVDKFTGDVLIFTSMLRKYIRQNKTIEYFLILESEAHTVNYGCKGVTVLFTDGTKWIKSSEKVDVNISSSGLSFYASAWIRLNQEDLKVLQSKKISAYRLYIYDTDLSIEESTRLSNAVKIIVNKK